MVDITSTDSAMAQLLAMSEKYRRRGQAEVIEALESPLSKALRRVLDAPEDDEEAVARAAAEAFGGLFDVFERANLRRVGDELGAGMMQSRLIATVSILGVQDGATLGENFVSGP